MRHTRQWYSGGFRHDYRALTKFALDHLPLSSWRRHGIGLLQAYIREAPEGSHAPEVRIHIWDPSARRDGIIDHGDVHNHRFALKSVVVHGSLYHTEYEFDFAKFGWAAYEVVHARADIGARYKLAPYHGYTEFGIKSQKETCIHAGSSYFFDRGAFHKTQTDRLTVTVVTKTNQIPDKALVVAKTDRPPVHAFELDDEFNVAALVARAREALR